MQRARADWCAAILTLHNPDLRTDGLIISSSVRPHGFTPSKKSPRLRGCHFDRCRLRRLFPPFLVFLALSLVLALQQPDTTLRNFLNGTLRGGEEPGVSFWREANAGVRRRSACGVRVRSRKNKFRPSPWHPNSFPISTIIHALSLLSNYPSRPFLFHLYQYCIGCTMPKKSGRSENTRWRRNCGKKIQARG